MRATHGNIQERFKSRDASPVFKGGLLTSMYLCQCISLGFVFGSLPVILRQSGVSLQAIGMVFLLHLPWALKFLCASWVDRLYLPRFGRRRSWILPLQWVGAGLLFFVSYAPPESEFQTMYWIMLALSIVMATNDIAVDGYATDILEPRQRAWGNTLQAGARFAGLILGSGLMLFLYASLGWVTVCRGLALTVLVLSLPTLLHRELAPVGAMGENEADTEDRDGQTGRAYGVIAFMKLPKVRRLLPVLIAPTAFVFAGIQIRMPMLVDLGMEPVHIGSLLLSYAYPIGLAGTLACGWLLGRLGEGGYMRLFSLVVVCLSVASAWLARIGHVEMWQAAILLTLDNLLIGAIQVWGFTLIMRVSAGPQAGTGFAVLSSLFLFLPLAGAPVFGALGDRLGYVALYLLFTCLVAVGYGMAEVALSSRRRCKLVNEQA